MNNYNFLRGNYQMDRDSGLNMFDDINNFFPNLNIQGTSTNTMGNINLYSPEEAYVKGNLFGDLYSQYKNYR